MCFALHYTGCVSLTKVAVAAFEKLASCFTPQVVAHDKTRIEEAHRSAVLCFSITWMAGIIREGGPNTNGRDHLILVGQVTRPKSPTREKKIVFTSMSTFDP